ncbi:MAG: hypothetical protein U0X91_21555 [Spirosomataceae bacterium]
MAATDAECSAKNTYIFFGSDSAAVFVFVWGSRKVKGGFGSRPPHREHLATSNRYSGADRAGEQIDRRDNITH